MKRTLSLLCLVILTIVLIGGCKKEKPTPSFGSGPEITDPNILTHIYRKTSKSPVRTVSLSSGVVPFYDRETKTLIYLTEEYEAGAGGYTEKILYSVRTLLEDGGESVVMTLAFPMSDGMIRGGFIDREGMTCAVTRYDENTTSKADSGRQRTTSCPCSRAGRSLSKGP